jgi:peptidoglycan hydrolase FlgJ
MSITAANHADVYTDFQGLAKLRTEARADSPKALREAARQFEALFLQQMLKSMREANMGEGLMDNDQSKHYQSMHDQQLAIDLSKGRGLGLAETLMRQLGGQFPEAENGTPVAMNGNHASQLGGIDVRRAPTGRERVAVQATSMMEGGTGRELRATEPGVHAAWESPQEFVQALRPHAERAAATLGTRPEVLIAQAALETGWGRAMPRHEDGSPSHNLFGIKADSRWDGERVAVQTMEFRDGLMQRERASFRSYDSLAQGFEDYVNFLRDNPRYQQALEAAGDGARYVRELQQAGYATDPEYADKINAILGGERLASALEVNHMPGSAT